MKVLDVNSLQSGIDQAINEITRFHDQISAVQRSIRDFCALDEDLKGETGEAIRNYFNECHQPFLVFMYESLIQFKQKLVHMKEAVKAFETNENGYIVEDFLVEDVDNSLTNMGTKTIELTNEANSIIDSVRDIVSITKIDETEVIENVQRGKKRVSEKVEELHALDKSQVSELNAVKEDLRVMKNYIANMESKFQSGSLSVSNYKIKQLSEMEAYKTITTRISDKAPTNSQSKANNFSSQQKTLNDIKEEKNEAMDNLDLDSQTLLEKAYADLKNGNISTETYHSIKSGLIQTGAAFVQKSVDKVITDKMVSETVTTVSNWMKKNTELLLDGSLVAQTASNTNVTFTEPPSWMKTAARTGTKYGGHIIGSAVDFGVQVYQGEDVTDASIKTAGHLAAGIAGASLGSAIPVPIVGTVTGFAVGVVGSMVFDWVYDNKEVIVNQLEEAGEGISKAIDKVGDAVSDAFSGLGSIFD
ncbi:hypothetical protein GLW20_00085 [Virgibacillus halodenitrificans]|nr:hypothetical protein [Virgibacillus halodenitrificans]